MTDDSSTASDTQIETSANPNELSTEMSDAELDSFVDQTLGITHKAAKEDKGAGGADAKAAEEKAAADKAEADKQAAGEAELTDEQKAEKAEADAKAKEEADKKAAEKAKAEIKEPEEPVKPVEIAAVRTDDLWVEVEALVEDGEGGTKPEKVKITVESGVPDNVRFKNDKQLYEVIDAVNEMRGILAERQTEHDEAVAAQETEKAKTENQTATLAAWDAEIEQLIEAELLEAPKAKVGEDGFAEDPTIVKIDQVFKFMTAKNEERIKDGKSPIKTFTMAFNMFNKAQSSDEEATKAKEAEAAAKKEAEETKKRGALVGGGHSGGAGGDKTPVYKRGSAKSIYQVDTSDI